MQVVVFDNELRYDYTCSNQHAVVMLVNQRAVIELEYGDCTATATTYDFVNIKYTKLWYCKVSKKQIKLNTARGRNLHKLTLKVCNLMYPILMEVNELLEQGIL